MNPRAVLALGVSLALRPWLWGDALVAVLRLARRGWWRSWPPVPSPDPEYVAWRTQTGHGDDARSPSGTAEDVLSYLTFCRGLRRSSRH